ncbi:hypothetical protein Q8A73_015845 [Channa argus]|nr:hypothetical protein Q8A73_015845 [Channa argus]
MGEREEEEEYKVDEEAPGKKKEREEEGWRRERDSNITKKLFKDLTRSQHFSVQMSCLAIVGRGQTETKYLQNQDGHKNCRSDRQPHPPLLSLTSNPSVTEYH